MVGVSLPFHLRQWYRLRSGTWRPLSPEGLRRGIARDSDIDRARTQLKSHLGGAIIVTETNKEIRFETKAGAEEMALRLAGSGSQVLMVAGARCPSYTRNASACCDIHLTERQAPFEPNACRSCL
jgi:hypothetical protein